MGRMNGKVVIVAGGSQGMGLATAELLACEGATVCIFARGALQGRKKAEALCREGWNVDFYEVNVTDRASIAKAYADIYQRHGRIDALVNCAGNMKAHGMPDACDEEMEKIARAVMEVNAFGTNNLASEIIRYMKDGGSIVFVGSLSATLVYPGDWAYIASKNAVMGLTKEYAVAYGPMGIRCNCILPSVVITPGCIAEMVAAGVPEEEVQDLSNPLGHPVQAEDIARVALFLVSDDSAAVSGQCIAVDGALSVSFPSAVY